LLASDCGVWDIDHGRYAIAAGRGRSYLARRMRNRLTEDSLMAESAEVAEDFFEAWTSKDFGRARSLLHDDVSFEGPIDAFSDADSYIASLTQLSGIVTGADKQKVFVDGDDVCVIYDLKTMPVPSSRTCEWYRVRDGKIASVSVVFDARPFAAMFEGQAH
jgi:ketosteroid isomerase-like protein